MLMGRMGDSRCRWRRHRVRRIPVRHTNGSRRDGLRSRPIVDEGSKGCSAEKSVQAEVTGLGEPIWQGLNREEVVGRDSRDVTMTRRSEDTVL